MTGRAAGEIAGPCATCDAPAGSPCRTRTTGRITDTHKARWLPIVNRRAARLAQAVEDAYTIRAIRRNVHEN